MSQVQTNSDTKNVEFAIENGGVRPPRMIFQPHIRPQCQSNVVALGTFETKLPPLNVREPLEGAMVDFNQLHQVCEHFLLGFGHVEATSRPTLRIALWIDRPKYLDHAIAAQVNRHACVRDIQFTDPPGLMHLNTHLAVAFQPCQPLLTEIAHQIQVVQVAVPTVKHQQPWHKHACLCHLQQRAEVVIFALIIPCFIVQAVDAGQHRITNTPYQANQINPLHHFVMIADQRYLIRIRFVQRRSFLRF